MDKGIEVLAKPEGTVAVDLLEDLTGRIQDLPQELYDIIEELVFSVAPTHETIEEVTKGWRPPLAANVNRDISEKYTKAYYENTVFTMRWSDICKWTAVFSQNRFRFVRVRVEVPHEPSQGAGLLLVYLCRTLRRRGVAMRQVEFSMWVIGMDWDMAGIKLTGEIKNPFGRNRYDLMDRWGASVVRRLGLD